MRVITFQPQHYAANVALIVNLHKRHDSRPMLLTPSGEVPAHTDQWQTYLSAVNFSRNDILQELTGNWYKMYTIDMLGYKELFVQALLKGKAVKTIRAMEDWYPLLTKLTNLDMSMTTNLHTNALSIHALSGKQVVKSTFSRQANARMYFANTCIASTRLVNIAIKQDDSFDELRFFVVGRNGVQTDVLLQPAITYDTTDYSIVTNPIGQQFTFSKAFTRFELSCTMFGETSVLCTSFNDLDKFREFVDVIDNGDAYVLQFAYNSNRTYRIVADVQVIDDETIPIGSLLVHSQDMLAHAALLGNVLKRNKYIVSIESPLQYNLAAVYMQYNLLQMQKYRWPYLRNNLAYEQTVYYVDNGVNNVFADFDRLSDYYFAKTQIQSGVTKPLPSYALHSMPDAAHGNDSLLYDEFLTDGTNDIAECYHKYDLPIIQNSTVFYYNLQIRFMTNAYDGTPFAMTFVHDSTMLNDTVRHELVVTNELVRIICYANNRHYSILQFAQGLTKLTQIQTFAVMPTEHFADFFVKQDTSN